MAAVDVAHALRPVVIFGEEERGIGTVAGVVVKQLVDRSQQALRSSRAIMRWLRRFACRFAIRRAPAIPLPEMSPSTSAIRSSPR